MDIHLKYKHRQQSNSTTVSNVLKKF